MLGTSYEVFVRYLLNDPTSWAFDMSYLMYGGLFFMAGAYTLSRNGHMRGDFAYPCGVRAVRRSWIWRFTCFSSFPACSRS